MITSRKLMRIVSIIVIILLVAPFEGLRDASGQQAPAGQYSKDELAQMLAPIALYPDSLLSQVLMASTYPLEIIEADRWVKQNSSLRGDSLDKALKDKTWDVSVKSLCYYPQPLAMLSEKLEWTSKLGNAFLSQQADVMSSVQELRARAKSQGNLKTTSQQKVVVEERYIKIEPASPTVVYVPAYNPVAVYGPWLYPAYPPYHYYYPGAVVTGAAISFGAGFAVGAAVAGWSHCNWGNSSINVNYNRTNNFNNQSGQGGSGNWQHNPQHRQGVAYKDKGTAQKYGQSSARSQQGTRGYGQRQEQGKQAQGMRSSQGQSQRQQGMSQRGASQRDSAFSGQGNRQSERSAASRGQQSRFSGGFDRGGSRGGGSMRGGGGRRR